MYIPATHRKHSFNTHTDPYRVFLVRIVHRIFYISVSKGKPAAPLGSKAAFQINPELYHIYNLLIQIAPVGLGSRLTGIHISLIHQKGGAPYIQSFPTPASFML